MRYPIIDGFRGFFLLFMGIIHLNQKLDVPLGKVNHHSFGWVEDAQGFVFISGLVVGLVYGGRYLKAGPARLSAGIWARIKTIYAHQAGLILLFAVLTALLLIAGQPVPDVLRPYGENPMGFVPAALALLAASAHMGILPMYIFFLLATPRVIRALDRGQAPLIFATMIALWLAAQTQLLEHATGALENAVADLGYPVNFGLYFNALAWQMFFFTGLFFGFRLACGKLDLGFLREPVWKSVFWLCLLVALCLGIYDRIVFDFWISANFSAEVQGLTSRGNLSVLYLLAFFVDLYLVVWLLVAGQAAGGAILPRAAAGLRWLFTRRPLVFLGQHSLQVFTYHILLAYAVHAWVEWVDPGAPARNLALLLGAASLYLPALAHARAARPKPAPQSPTAPVAARYSTDIKETP